MQKDLGKELREGEKYLTLVNMNNLLKDFQQSLIMQGNQDLTAQRKDDQAPANGTSTQQQ